MRIRLWPRRKPTLLSIVAVGGALLVFTLCQLAVSSLHAVTLARRTGKGLQNSWIRQPELLRVFGQPSVPKAEVAARFAARRKHLTDACRRLNLTRYRGIRNAEARFVFPTNTTPTVLYCPVPKTGTTYLKNTFARANNHSAAIWIDRFYVRPVVDYDSAVMFFFTREPYSRILSAYVDKLWSPNLQFWRVLGRSLVKAVRPNATVTSLECGHDVTFPEFIRYFIDGFRSGERVNTHLVPTHKFCEVCDFDYDYIGKLETFRDDVAFILSAINITSTDNFNNDDGIVTEHIAQAFYTEVIDKAHCLPKYQLLLRAWRALQIRGSISLDKRFPLPAAMTTKMTKDVFTLVVRKTVQESRKLFRDLDRRSVSQSTPKAEHFGQSSADKLDARAQQKKKVLASAYSLIPLEDKVRLSQLVREEFELFEYDLKNRDVFAPDGSLYDNIFDVTRI